MSDQDTIQKLSEELEKAKVTIKEQQQVIESIVPPEAVYSFSTNVLTMGELGGTWTIRARVGEEGKAFFHRADNFIKYALEHGWKTPPAPQSAPAMAQTMTPMQPVPNGVPAPAPTQSGEGTCTAILMKVGKSFKGDKPQLVFEVKEQNDPLKYTGKSVDDLIRFLSPVGQYTPQLLVLGAKFNVNYLLRWSKTADGKYQNIERVERLDN